ncbi:Mu transposase C-terminal domain-containing protein [Maledivibacter halophilus]|uniref:Helix-turn-helix domain-containing protein n=1 Tax=Maledivibacter halophilus TaxID=36842 RepID=A0A1T5KY30_9FIRM|nr:Mu transposase C-terminal domain-containing protein [Maledivibacter halophilus]SKC68563.1 Helix-turn-helix domain-containing protein [Maledivibacter halophilus]SKC71587.1 Helix-turn-helix domain-containing protein [Maledivibacter halophilus]SKC80263.1 Helix-turn-helix domain-containing protein [Maledivibacter halophilus]
MKHWISTQNAAEICGVDESTIRRRISLGRIEVKEVINEKNLKIYLVDLSSLPPEAQIKYFEKISGAREIGCTEEINIDADLASYREKHGEEGMHKLLKKYELVQRALSIDENVTKLRKKLAKENEIGFRTLYNWIKDYEKNGLAGLMKKEKSNKGKSMSFCLEAEMLMKSYYLTPIRRTKTASYEKMVKEAERLGSEACDKCRFNQGSKLRKKLEAQGYVIETCKKENKKGMKYSKCSKSASRILNSIPEEIVAYARRGKKYWEANFMHKADRKKPEIVNECWFGDHYRFNAFAVDKDGNVARPWLTAWYDIATGCMVGWCITMQPNSRTIAEAFIYGIQEKKDFPFWGVPKVVYTDNGKDYRSHAFEGGKIIEKKYANAIEYNLETEGLLKQLKVGNIHAKAYHGWVKPVERFFGTFSDKYVREIPGWCGTDPEERPETFAKDLKRLIKHNKLWTLDELKEWFVNIVLKEYHNTPHGGYGGKTPMELYMEKEKARYDKPSWAVLGICKMESEKRKISTQGIRFDNKIYWNIELKHLIGQWVKIKFNRENKDVIIVTHEGKYICAASVKEKLKMVFEDEEKVSNHVSNQRKQEREVKERIAELTGKSKPKPKKSSANTLTGEIVEGLKGNITVLEYEKAMKDYDKELKALKKDENKENKKNPAKKRFIKTGESVLKRPNVI